MYHIFKTNILNRNIVNQTFPRFSRNIQVCRINRTIPSLKTNHASIDHLIKKHKENLFYSEHIERMQMKLGFRGNSVVMSIIKKKKNKELMKNLSVEPLPISLKYLIDEEPNESIPVKHEDVIVEEENPTQFPYQLNNTKVNNEISTNEKITTQADDFDMEVRTRLELYNKPDDHLKWMHDYENYSLPEEDDVIEKEINYGTPDPRSRISKVPCGGCGAFLHCKDTAIPGYIPSELFSNYDKQGGTDLKGLTCQRCHFLTNYNLALQVRVSSDDYPKVLYSIAKRKQALVILMVDLLDFPCSIWPGIADLIGHNRPIVVVGNKVDLLPRDGRGYLEHVKNNLLNSVKLSGFGMANIKHVALISAQTGFGVEELITKIQYMWQYKGDVYLVGCTNVGKSSLYNALLQSDFCKSQASDLIQRATTSPWPGTTLNLLKFPIMRLNGWKLHVRSERLKSSRKLEQQENKLRLQQLRETKNPKYATLIGHIDKTFTGNDDDAENQEPRDIFSVKPSLYSENSNTVGIDENDKVYALSKWCYDTPGVIQPDQIIHLLTTEELVLTFPKEIIKPRTYSLQPGSTIFIAGLARLDYLEGDSSARFTIFRSSNLPITICRTTHADEIYRDFLGTEMFVVPTAQPERLKMWPKLEPLKNLRITGIDKNQSAADVVLSSAGWVAVTPDCGHNCTVQAWTPERRGIYLRDCLLPRAVSFRGKKILNSCAYRNNKLYLDI